MKDDTGQLPQQCEGGGILLNQIFNFCSERWNSRRFSLQKVAGWHFLFWDDPLQIRGNGFNGSRTDIFSFCCFVLCCAFCLCLQTAFCAESKIKELLFAFMPLFVSVCDHRTAGRCSALIGPFLGRTWQQVDHTFLSFALVFSRRLRVLDLDLSSLPVPYKYSSRCHKSNTHAFGRI